jgi:hypothetical protein
LHTIDTIQQRKPEQQPLPALAVMPVQRVPRYKLLIEEIIKHTPETHSDLPALKEGYMHTHTIDQTQSINQSDQTEH